MHKAVSVNWGDLATYLTMANQRGEGEGAIPSAGWTRPTSGSANSWLAITSFAASVGWYASQNTYSLRSLQSLEFGKQRPPTVVSTLQQDVWETLNPAPVRTTTSHLYIFIMRLTSPKHCKYTSRPWIIRCNYYCLLLPYCSGWLMSSKTMS